MATGTMKTMTVAMIVTLLLLLLLEVMIEVMNVGVLLSRMLLSKVKLAWHILANICTALWRKRRRRGKGEGEKKKRSNRRKRRGTGRWKGRKGNTDKNDDHYKPQH